MNTDLTVRNILMLSSLDKVEVRMFDEIDGWEQCIDTYRIDRTAKVGNIDLLGIKYRTEYTEVIEKWGDKAVCNFSNEEDGTFVLTVYKEYH